jgi:hypothetical protein
MAALDTETPPLPSWGLLPGSSSRIVIMDTLPCFGLSVGLLQQICAPFGRVLAMTVYQFPGHVAVVQFDSVEAADKACAGLHGQAVYRNDQNQLLDVLDVMPTFLPLAAQIWVANTTTDQATTTATATTTVPPSPQPEMSVDASPESKPDSDPGFNGISPPPHFGEKGRVLMVHNLEARESNARHVMQGLFVLFSAHGHVPRIKIMHGGKTALVEFEWRQSATAARIMLHATWFQGCKLDIRTSTHISRVSAPLTTLSRTGQPIPNIWFKEFAAQAKAAQAKQLSLPDAKLRMPGQLSLPDTKETFESKNDSREINVLEETFATALKKYEDQWQHLQQGSATGFASHPRQRPRTAPWARDC